RTEILGAGKPAGGDYHRVEWTGGWLRGRELNVEGRVEPIEVSLDLLFATFNARISAIVARKSGRDRPPAAIGPPRDGDVSIGIEQVDDPSRAGVAAHQRGECEQRKDGPSPRGSRTAGHFVGFPTIGHGPTYVFRDYHTRARRQSNFSLHDEV